MLYVYAIVDVALESLGRGLYGAALRSVGGGGVDAIASDHERAPQSGVEELWRHEEVVERLMGTATVLPMRFGTTAATDAELEATLEARRQEFNELLDDLSGAVELSVRVEPGPPAEFERISAGGDPARPASGTAYMEERSRALRSIDDARARYHEPLSALSRRCHVPGGRLRSGAYKAAYLVDANEVGAFTALVDKLGEEGEARVSCTGPWPPYSFVSEERR